MKVYLIRHAEATHNVNNNYGIFDPQLTPKGIQQSKDKSTNNDLQYVNLVISSTAHRTLETAKYIFPNKSIYATDLLLEYNTGVNCNKRNELNIQKKRFSDVDFEKYRSDPLPIETHWNQGDERASKVMNILKEVKEEGYQSVALVTHFNFMRHLFIALSGEDNTNVANCQHFCFDL